MHPQPRIPSRCQSSPRCVGEGPAQHSGRRSVSRLDLVSANLRLGKTRRPTYPKTFDSSSSPVMAYLCRLVHDDHQVSCTDSWVRLEIRSLCCQCQPYGNSANRRPVKPADSEKSDALDRPAVWQMCPSWTDSSMCVRGRECYTVSCASRYASIHATPVNHSFLARPENAIFG